MAQSGIPSEDDRVEPIAGEIIKMTPISSRHAGRVNRLASLFMKHAGRRAIVSVQNPTQLGDLPEPRPGPAILTFRDDFFANQRRAAD